MHQQSVIKYVYLSKFQKESENLREEIDASQRIYSQGNVSLLSLLLAKSYNKTVGDLVKKKWKKLKKIKSSHMSAEIFSLVSIQKIVLV